MKELKDMTISDVLKVAGIFKQRKKVYIGSWRRSV